MMDLPGDIGCRRWWCERSRWWRLPPGRGSCWRGRRDCGRWVGSVQRGRSTAGGSTGRSPPHPHPSPASYQYQWGACNKNKHKTITSVQLCEKWRILNFSEGGVIPKAEGTSIYYSAKFSWPPLVCYPADVMELTYYNCSGTSLL